VATGAACLRCWLQGFGKLLFVEAQHEMDRAGRDHSSTKVRRIPKVCWESGQEFSGHK